MPKFKYSKLWYLVGSLLAANLAVVVALHQVQTQDYGRLYFFDVGQGDAIYLRTAQGNDVLIDGGPGDAVLSKLGRVMPFWDRSLELVILTHPHADHASGLIEVLKRFQVKQILLPGVAYDSATYQTFLDLKQKKAIATIHPRLGQRLFLDRSTVLDIYYPLVNEFSQPPKDVNDVSVVGRLSFGKMNVLLTGDAGKQIENFLVAATLPLNSEVLKIGHHGSHHSSSPEFLEAIGPDYSVISVGKNTYGHPHEEVLGLLRSQKTQLLRTDKEGDIAFKLYRDKIVLQSEK